MGSVAFAGGARLDCNGLGRFTWNNEPRTWYRGLQLTLVYLRFVRVYVRACHCREPLAWQTFESEANMKRYVLIWRSYLRSYMVRRPPCACDGPKRGLSIPEEVRPALLELNVEYQRGTHLGLRRVLGLRHQ